MKLVQRVSVFFLVALFIVLAGYSLTLFMGLRYYLNQDFDSRLNSALQILTASIEVEPEDVTWYPEEYTLDFESRELVDARWIVVDETCRIVGQSPNLSSTVLRDAVVVDYSQKRHDNGPSPVNLDGWRIAQAYVEAPTPQPPEDREWNEHASLLVTVAMSRVRLEQRMRELAIMLTVLPLSIWCLAALVGRRYASQTLQPLRKMIALADEAPGPAFQLRLPSRLPRDELSDLADAFNRLFEQLEEVYQREQQFSSNAAHQLRTPLTILRGEVEVALRKKRNAVEYEECLQRVAEVGSEMEQVVEMLLLLARHDSVAPMKLELETIALEHWLNNYHERWSSHICFGRLRVRCEDNGPIETSVPLLLQVVDNLIDNALRYSPADSIVELASRPAEDPDEVELVVIDRGAGVSSDDVPHIFDPFFRSRRTRTGGDLSDVPRLHDTLRGRPGTGLGLAVAHRIVSVLRGSLEYQRRPEGTTEFICRLPRVHNSR